MKRHPVRHSIPQGMAKGFIYLFANNFFIYVWIFTISFILVSFIKEIKIIENVFSFL